MYRFPAKLSLEQRLAYCGPWTNMYSLWVKHGFYVLLTTTKKSIKEEEDFMIYENRNSISINKGLREISMSICLHITYGCINVIMAELWSMSSILPSKHSHTIYSVRLFLRSPSPLIPVIFIVKCQSFRSCHIKCILIYFLCTLLPSQPHETVTWVWDRVSWHTRKAAAPQMLISIVDSHDSTFQMLP